ncbi:MAG: YraN family protein [Candidatus Margulisiibacteriota bacterium]|jgi:putative endonuclease
MPKSHRAIGYEGESAAEAYLLEQGYTILEKNFTTKHGEIDIVAKEGDYLVFVEVKNHSREDYGTMLEKINAKKQQRIIFAARCYLKRANDMDIPCRFDVVTILNKQNGTPQMELIKDAFRVEK